MNKSKPLAGFSLWVSLTILLVISAALAVIALSDSSAKAASGPSFNKVATSFDIQLDEDRDGDGNNDVISNVASSNGQYEHNFVRVGSNWDMQGNYPNGGNNFEACEAGTTVTVWVYVHNTIVTSDNHLDEDMLDFQGTAIAKAAKVELGLQNQDNNAFSTSHTLTGTLSADNAASKSDTARVYCDDHKIGLTQVAGSTQIHSWSNLSINRLRHQKAQQVFDSPYGILNPEDIFSGGSQVGYAGNLPACRYYAAYVQVELTVVLPEPELAPTGSIGPELPPVSRTQIPEISNLGAGDAFDYSLLGIASGVAITLAVGQRAAIAKTKRRK